MAETETKSGSVGGDMPEEKVSTRNPRVIQYENRISCGRCGHVHLGRCPHCDDCPQIVPPAADAGPRQPINCADPNHKSGSVFHVDGGLCPLAGYEPPAANEPNIHDRLVMGWLVSNAKTPDEVKWASYPIGMVQRWIERAQEAEAKIGCAPPVPQEAAPMMVNVVAGTPDLEGLNEALIAENKRRATAPDEAMRVAREIYAGFEQHSGFSVEQIATLVRQAGSERERELRRKIADDVDAKMELLLDAVFEKEENKIKVREVMRQTVMAEASRLLGGE